MRYEAALGHGGNVLKYYFTEGSEHRYAMQMRVTVQIERGGGEGPVSQIAEIAGELVLTTESVEDGIAVLRVATQKLEGEVPANGFFGEADVGDPLDGIPERIVVGPRGATDLSVDAQQDATEGTLDSLFPLLPEEEVQPGAAWSQSQSTDLESDADPLVVHGRFIGLEPGDDGLVRPVVGTFSGHAWSAGQGLEGVGVTGELRRMAEVSFRQKDGWAHRADSRVESTLRIEAAPGVAGEGSRTIETTVEMLLTELS